MKKPTHIKNGKASMVDVSSKTPTERYARASGRIYMKRETLEQVKKGTVKGEVLGVARIAGILGAKKTSGLVPLCHPLQIQNINIDFSLNEDESYVEATCEVNGVERTGFEMEAITGVMISLLTIYDMLKSVEKGMVIGDIHLVEKRGGKSGKNVFMK